MRNLYRHPGAGRFSGRRQGGFVLIVGLMMLVVVTVLSVSMFRSFGLQERIAGNTREKQRALEAAQSALQHGEWWLRQGGAGTGANCTGAAANGNVKEQMKVCSNALSAPETLPWTNKGYIEYVPPSMAVQAGGGLDTTSGDINYYGKPGLYISYLGMAPDGLAVLYQVSAFGYGGSASTAAVVQSTYKVDSASRPLDAP